MMTKTSGYQHTQWGPLCLLIYAIAGVYFVIALVLRNEPPMLWIMLPLGVLMLLLAASFHQLTVKDHDDRLLISFGPIPLFRRTVRYDDIEKAEIGRTLILDGWGIHYSIRGGWVWNLWGRDCVVLHLRKGVLRIGTDDAENLAGFLQRKISDR
jgi:hypothetical protein